MTGQETRNSCTAGYKAIWQKASGYPSREYLAALHPDLADVVETKMHCSISPLGAKAPRLNCGFAPREGTRP